MINLSKADVCISPFPHAYTEEFLPAETYASLKSDFPETATFENEKAEHGLTGSRTEQGFDIYRGDLSYSKLLEKSAAWREFDLYINSKLFIEKFLELFGDTLDSIGCLANIVPEAYDRDYIEPREVMTAHKSFKDRLLSLQRMLGSSSRGDNLKLFTRLDIHRARQGYGKAVHCDRPNRLCSMIVYFSSLKGTGIEGGDLTIHAHVKHKEPHEYERHPDPADAPVVRNITPVENSGILFPCCNNSYHGVTPVMSEAIERDYLYINISAISHSIW